jgi:hypothetical protein
MQDVESCAVLSGACYPSRMDARAVAGAAEVSVGRLNVWVQQGAFEGLLQSGVRGRRRDIDVETAIRIAVFAALVETGVPLPQASRHIRGFLPSVDAGWLIVARAPPGAPVPITNLPTLEDVFDRLREIEVSPGPRVLRRGLASSVRLVSIASIARRVREAEQAWLASRKAEKTDAN